VSLLSLVSIIAKPVEAFRLCKGRLRRPPKPLRDWSKCLAQEACKAASGSAMERLCAAQRFVNCLVQLPELFDYSVFVLRSLLGDGKSVGASRSGITSCRIKISLSDQVHVGSASRRTTLCLSGRV